MGVYWKIPSSPRGGKKHQPIFLEEKKYEEEEKKKEENVKKGGKKKEKWKLKVKRAKQMKKGQNKNAKKRCMRILLFAYYGKGKKYHIR